jgi:hypothetical protein
MDNDAGCTDPAASPPYESFWIYLSVALPAQLGTLPGDVRISIGKECYLEHTSYHLVDFTCITNCARKRSYGEETSLLTRDAPVGMTIGSVHIVTSRWK